MRGKGVLALGVAVSALAVLAGSAQGAVTIGSNLAGVPQENMPGCGLAGTPCTATNLSLPAASQAAGGLTSPVNGAVTSWRASANMGNNISLQVLRPVSSTTYAGVATSAPASWPGPGISPSFATSLPISQGEAIGLLSPNGELIFARPVPGAAVGVWYLAPTGPLADGATRTADATGTSTEVLVQATIEPTNSIKFGTLTRNKKKGSATVAVTVPNPGQLSYSGTGVNVTGPASAAAPGEVQLTVRATGKKAKKLKKKGKASVTFGTTFTPNFGAASITPDSLTLRKKLKKKK